MNALVLPSYAQDDEYTSSGCSEESLVGRCLALLVRLRNKDPSVAWKREGRAEQRGVRGERNWGLKRRQDAASYDLLVVLPTGEFIQGSSLGTIGRGQASYVETFLLAGKPVLAYVQALDRMLPVRAAVATGEDDYQARFASLVPA